MNKLIRNLSPTVELIIILILGFGIFIYSSTVAILSFDTDNNQQIILKITSQGHYFIIIYEVVILFIIGYILKIRRWVLKDFNLEFSFKLIWTALLLMIIRNFVGGIGYMIFEALKIVGDSSTTQVKLGFEITWLSVTLMIVVNSVFEELLLIGYLFKRLEKYSPAFIIGISTLIRYSYHTYQGWDVAFMIVPMGIVFGFYYYKYKKLWPLIIAHGLSNLIAHLGSHYHWFEGLDSM